MFMSRDVLNTHDLFSFTFVRAAEKNALSWNLIATLEDDVCGEVEVYLDNAIQLNGGCTYVVRTPVLME